MHLLSPHPILPKAWQHSARRTSLLLVAATRKGKPLSQPEAAETTAHQADVYTTASQTESERRAARRKAVRVKRGRTTKGLVTDMIQYIQSQCVRKDASGKAYMDRGVLGRDTEGLRQRRTYAVQVLAGSEHKYAEYLQKGFLSLPGVDDEGELIDRTISIRIPEKDTLEFSNRTFKLTKRRKLYGDGGWVFIEAIMDNHLYEQITRTYYYQTWHFKAAYKDDEGKLYDIPQPCPDQFLVQLQEWEASADPLPDKEDLEEEFFGEAASVYQELSLQALDSADPASSAPNSIPGTLQPAQFHTGVVVPQDHVSTGSQVAATTAIQLHPPQSQATRVTAMQPAPPTTREDEAQAEQAAKQRAEQLEDQQLLAWGAAGCNWASTLSLSSAQQKQHMRRAAQQHSQQSASGVGYGYGVAQQILPYNQPAGRLSTAGPNAATAPPGPSSSPPLPAAGSTTNKGRSVHPRRQGRELAEDVGAFQVDPLQMDEEFQYSTYRKSSQNASSRESEQGIAQDGAIPGNDVTLVSSGRSRRR